MKDEQYPIGLFECPYNILEADLHYWIDDIRSLPNRLKALTKNLDKKELGYTYREGSWTIQQLVHHIADSHMNGYIRMKLALTEEIPTVKTYEESKWMELYDSELPINISLSLLEGLHAKWACLLEHLTPVQLQRQYKYPNGDVMRIEQSIALYAWHGNHHLAHIQHALNR
ncbi:YfiT family bacillithiol transferase [Pseudobacillus wudalianchiensis]|uniref:Putative metal-dependent hydrolase A8F95_03935 n=1 Tax=Pseudobacillus wudalianchiensis TaxID=1743143 RepID=A0A1B9B9R8_9BACI|nr:putative metal-dependent hydrolase [Bacillus wudalianchiensis]OCA92846.1 metal-dependent hydrolase [Bacillus wudalianchiensis]